MMNLKYFEDEEFLDDFYESLENSEFINCTFSSFDFSGYPLKNSRFLECTFTKCNLSNLDLTNAAFRDVKFCHSKLIGNNFSSTKSLFQIGFEDCNLDFSVFQGVEIISGAFKKCSLRDIDFSESSLEGASFDDCDLSKSNFSGANLFKADFSTAYGYYIDPKHTKIKKAKFSMPEAIVLLKALEIEIE